MIDAQGSQQYNMPSHMYIYIYTHTQRLALVRQLLGECNDGAILMQVHTGRRERERECLQSRSNDSSRLRSRSQARGAIMARGKCLGKKCFLRSRGLPKPPSLRARKKRCTTITAQQATKMPPHVYRVIIRLIEIILIVSISVFRLFLFLFFFSLRLP